MSNDSPEKKGNTAVIEKTKPKLKQPQKFKVLLHNDDYTTREFVVFILKTIFHHDEQSSVKIMWHVHTTGVGVAGIYTYEVAETKQQKVMELAEAEEFPLRVSIEQE